jgi:NAD(P)-dependent dehydrogenase (short-subunit alcohol dehydrogenase family)
MNGSMGPILITGCSTGIGRVTALHLLGRGCTVYATARRPETLDELAAAGATTLALDVTDEGSMRCAVQTVEAAHGAVAVLVNNAGYGEFGPIEEVAMARVRSQFETNVFGLVRLTQLVLPAMRTARAGRIVNISSVAGRLSFPTGGLYSASKHAVEALSDALRVEVARFGIHVSLIEPGHHRSAFTTTMVDRMRRDVGVDGGPYGALKRTLVRSVTMGRYPRTERDPMAVAEAIAHAATSPRPRARYVVPSTARLMLLAYAWLPTRVVDGFLGRMGNGSAQP